jgi:O-acetylhomoserine (thiol)-lyase
MPGKKKTTQAKSSVTKAQKPAFGFDTLCIQGGYDPKVGEPRILPIIQSTTYKYDDIDQVNRIMTLQEFGHKYSRTSNPTISGFEDRMNLLEGGVAAVATASGQAANLLAIINIVRPGDHSDSHSHQVMKKGQERRWREEHAAFIAAYNDTLHAEGLPLDE